jgi:hypothetical protein
MQPGAACADPANATVKELVKIVSRKAAVKRRIYHFLLIRAPSLR